MRQFNSTTHLSRTSLMSVGSEIVGSSSKNFNSNGCNCWSKFWLILLKKLWSRSFLLLVTYWAQDSRHLHAKLANLIGSTSAALAHCKGVRIRQNKSQNNSLKGTKRTHLRVSQRICKCATDAALKLANALKTCANFLQLEWSLIICLHVVHKAVCSN